MEMTEDLINQAISIAKSYKSNFGVNILKLKLHVCLRLANQLLDELENRNIIKIVYEPKYKITVL